MRKEIIGVLIIIMILNITVLTSCWNYVEINDKRIVSGAAVDYDEKNDKIILTVETVTNRLGKETERTKQEIFYSEGSTIFEAIRNIIEKSGQKLFWSHAKVMVLSKSLLKNKNKFLGVIDFMDRDVELRDNIWLFVSRNKEAREILEANLQLDKIVAYHLEDMMENKKSVSKFHAVQLWEFVDKLAIKGISPVLPLVSKTTYNNRDVVEVFGTVVFKNLESVGFLNGIETKSFLLVINELKGGTLVVQEDKLFDKPIKIAMEIFDNKTKITPVYSDEKLIMNIDVKTKVNINEIGAKIDLTDEKKIKKLQEKGEQIIKNDIQNVIKKVQKEYRSDIFGFGTIIERKFPKQWKKIRDKWDEYFLNLNIKVNVDLSIKGTALRLKSIDVED
ncbi:Ger(x)C family spore germination protein [Caminicella sporogenes]|uniref:Ger(x)C family spore germination protein n=1 Tax=Caminicella sporogenes TaxID=166485 RepID=UPI002540257B|nr:Ger(x)C family spore germination protein [Caminicella sporogenes]WIF95765.1 Ger(x)C family spore germination protein [Caminicella sporogenes]